MKIQMLYDQGSSPAKEDGIIDSYPFFGVIDATSAPFSPSHPAHSFGGLTDGERVAETIAYVFAAETHFPPFGRPLDRLIKQANIAVKDFRADPFFGAPANTRRLMGASIAVVRVDDDSVSLIQAGDCMAFWWRKGKKSQESFSGLELFSATKNQVRRHDEELRKEISRLMRQILAEEGIALETANGAQISAARKKMWNEFYPILVAARRRDINNPKSRRGYGFLNGDPNFPKMCCEETIERSGLDTIILCTDGMLPWSYMGRKTDGDIGLSVIKSFERAGLAAVLAATRKAEKKNRTTSHVDFAEATAIAIEF